MISTDDVEGLDGQTVARGLGEVYDYRPGWGLPARRDQEEIVALLREGRPAPV